MAPPKAICSVYAEVYAVYAQILITIADIKAALSKAIKIKNGILYGTLSIVDAAGAEIVSAASAVASVITSQLLSRASSVASTAIEAILAPLFSLIMLGPDTLFGLINLPLKEAIKSCDAERRYLSNAQIELGIILSIISKWTVEFNGGKYAQKMEQTIPYLESAIKKCDMLIQRLDTAENDNGVRSAYFDQGIYNSMRGDLESAIQITKSDSILVNSSKIEERIEQTARREYTQKITVINNRYKEDKKDITNTFLSEKPTVASQAEYAARMTALDSKRKIDVEAAKLSATANAIRNKSLYSGILNDIRDQFAYDMQILKRSLESFLKNIGFAYLQYRNSQSMTYTTYTIRNLINLIIQQIIELLTKAGNGAGAAVEGIIRLARSLMDSVNTLYTGSVEKFYSTTETISSTGLAANLAAGNGTLTIADTVLSSSITQSIIDIINSDETLLLSQNRFNILFGKIKRIRDWDGKPDVWGTDPLNSVSPPYGRLLASTVATISTLVTIGLVPNETAVAATRKRMTETAKILRSLIRHNQEVNSALKSYTPPSSIYVEKLRSALEKLGPLWAILGAFNLISIIARVAGDVIVEGFDKDDIPSVSNCKIEYPELFDPSKAIAEKAIESMKTPAHFNSDNAAFEESADLKREQAIVDARAKIPIEDSDVHGSPA